MSLRLASLGASFGLLLGMCSCGLNPYSEITQEPSTKWSIEDCRVIVAHASSHNFFDKDSKLVVTATPFTPLVVTALGRLQQKAKLLSEAKYHGTVDELAFFNLGMFVDWEQEQYIDKHGNFYKKTISDLDSLLILLTIKNKTWPCVPPVVFISVPNKYGGESVTGGGGFFPLFELSDWPCYAPDITDLEDRIFLENWKKERLTPRFVWGRKHTILNKEETLYAMFPLRQGTSHFLEKCQTMYLVITGFENIVRLKFDLSTIQ